MPLLSVCVLVPYQQMDIAVVLAVTVSWTSDVRLSRSSVTVCLAVHHRLDRMLASRWILTWSVVRAERRPRVKSSTNSSVVSRCQLKRVLMPRATCVQPAWVFLLQTRTLLIAVTGSLLLLGGLICIYCWMSCSPEDIEIMLRESFSSVFPHLSWRSMKSWAAISLYLSALISSTKIFPFNYKCYRCVYLLYICCC